MDSTSHRVHLSWHQYHYFCLGHQKFLDFPSKKTNFKLTFYYRSTALMLVGTALLGSACSFIFVPLLPEIISAVQDKENIGENDELNDKGASVFNFAYALGCLIAPILGGLFNDLIDFRYTCDLMAVCAGTFALLYFLVNLLPFLIAKNKKSASNYRVERAHSRNNSSVNSLRIEQMSQVSDKR